MTGRPTLLLICGLPGAGKTTLAERLAVEVPAVRLCPDEWMADLEVSLNDEPFRDRLERRFRQLAFELLAATQSVIMENGFWVRSERDELRQAAHSANARAELHFLDVPTDELWRRLYQRNQRAEPGTVPATRAQLEEWAASFEAPTTDELALFDPPRLLTRDDRFQHD